MGMETIGLIFFMIFILTYITLYISDDLWGRIKLYSPEWGIKETLAIFTYLFLISLTYNLMINGRISRLDYTLFVLTALMFAFTIFSLAKSTIEEAFVFGTITLFLVMVNVFYSLILKNSNSKLSSMISVIIYSYLYVWLISLNDNYID